VYSEWGFIRYFRLVVIPQLLFLAVWFIAAWGLTVAFGTVPLGWELARPAIIGWVGIFAVTALWFLSSNFFDAFNVDDAARLGVSIYVGTAAATLAVIICLFLQFCGVGVPVDLQEISASIPGA